MMKIQINKAFLRELSKVPFKERKRVEKLLFTDVESYSILYEIPNIRKLKGYSNYFKFRIGDYRIGLKYENDILTFERILHRKDIYKFFP